MSWKATIRAVFCMRQSVERVSVSAGLHWRLPPSGCITDPPLLDILSLPAQLPYPNAAALKTPRCVHCQPPTSQIKAWDPVSWKCDLKIATKLVPVCCALETSFFFVMGQNRSSLDATSPRSFEFQSAFREVFELEIRYALWSLTIWAQVCVKVLKFLLPLAGNSGRTLSFKLPFPCSTSEHVGISIAV